MAKSLSRHTPDIERAATWRLVESGFSETNRAINARTRTVVYAFRFELASRPPVEAPFGKLSIQLVESHAHLPSATARQLLDVMTAWLHVDEKDLFDELARSNAMLLGLTDGSISGSRSETAAQGGSPACSSR